MDLLVFDRPPKPFDEDVISPRAFAVHADLDACIPLRIDEVEGRKLATLIRIHDLGFAVVKHGVF